jgi:sulfane dehydrogenase subunit SoxC
MKDKNRGKLLHPSTLAVFEHSIDRDRRTFLAQTAGIAAATASSWATPAAAAQAADAAPVWMRVPGAPMRGYGQPSKYEGKVLRAVVPNFGELAPGTGTSRTPLQLLEGTITPNGLHFERHHNGVPDIDPAQHKLLIHGFVRKPIEFSIEALLRYPMVSRTCFIECAGNSGLNTLPKPPQTTAGMIHGLVSCSEWTGVPLSLLLKEAELDSDAQWLLAEGADSAAMSRSIPLRKALDDALIALYQNGERIRPEQGYPVRLLLPGYEGNMHVKWLRRLKATDAPTHTKDETSKYSDLMRDGKARQFTFVMGVKSVITAPSGGMTMQGPGLYEVSGLAWSGAGRITRVDVSADGGATWKQANLGPSLPQSLTRFRLPWEWNGASTQLQSRAVDDKGHVQETRAEWNALYSPANRFHNTMIQTWAVNRDGTINNVYL